ncbi:MAG: CBS domain-containing protein [bacterium]|nr:CBS domain-containing protein [bacterium]
MSKLKVTDMMTKDVVSVNADMPLFEAAKIIIDHNFDGVPVVDKENKLIGIITEYNLISQSSSVHLPTLQKILKDLKVLGEDKSYFEKEFEDIIALKVKDVMNREPPTLRDNANYEEVLAAFREHHNVNPIPVVDAVGKVVGVVSRYDVLRGIDKKTKLS